MLLALMLPFASQAQNSWTVADGTTTHAKVPLDFYNCDGSGVRQAQMLYPASLLTDMVGSSIASITFYHQNTGSKTVTASPWLIKMGSTTLSDLSEGLSSDELTTVYSGNLVVTSGVMSFEFSAPYTYSGGNLIVEIYTTGANSNWYGSNNQGCYGMDNIGSTYSSMSSPNYTAFLPKTTFTEAPSCFPVTDLAIDAAATTTTSLTLTWTDAVNAGATYTVVDMSDASVLQSNIAGTTYTATGLNANTAYTFGVVSDCGGDVADTLTVSGRTACGATVTGTTWDFETETTGATPSCWTKVGTGTVAVTANTSYATNSHAGNNYLKFSGSTSNLVVLPETEDEISTLQLRIWTRPENVTNPNCGTFSVGYITDISDATTFVATNTYAYNDFSDYAEKTATFGGTPAGARMAMRHNAGSTSWYWYVDDVTIEEAPSCLPVSGLAVDATATTSSSITLTWVSDATSFVIYDMADSSAVATTTNNTYTINGLNANTAYTFGVAVNCSGEMSDTNTVSGRTACDIIATLPWTDGMEAVPTGSNVMPFCWSRYNNSTSSSYNYYPYSNNSSSNAHEGTRALYWSFSTYGSYADTTIAILPQLDVTSYPMNGNQLSFYGRMSTSSASIAVQVGTMSDPADPTTFVASSTVTVSGNVYTRFDVNLTEANATDAYAAIMVLKPSGSAYLYIDDVTLQEAPSCLYVTEAAVSAVTSESMTLTWVDTRNEAGVTYTVYDSEGAVESGITATTYTVPNLDANTAYTFGIAANCGAGNESEVITVSGRTACTAFAMPFTENFNTLTAGIPSCWDNSEGTTTSATYRWNYYATGHEGAGLRFNSYSNSNNNTNILVTPAITIDEAAQLSFWYKNPTGGDFTVMVSTDGIDFDTLATGLTAVSDWTKAEIVLDAAYVGENVNIYFKGTSNYGSGDAYIYLDDVMVDVAPSCLPVTNLVVSDITATGATLTWEGEADGYDVWDMSDPTTPYQYANTNSVDLYALDANTEYTFGVTAVCGTDESDTVTITFRTACTAQAIPFTEDFENGINCWTLVDCATSTGVGTTNVYSGTKSFKFNYNTNPPQYLISPELSGTENGMKVSFMYRAGGSYTESFALGYSTTTSDVTAFTWLSEVTGITSNTYESYEGIMPADVKYVAVKYTANDKLALYIDSMVFDMPPSCLPVTDLAVDAVTANSITLSWTGDAASYSIVDADGSVVASNITTTTYQVTGLTASTSYTFGVVAHCTATESSDATIITATTDCEGGSCAITIVAEDAYGDGWYGSDGSASSLEIRQNGALIRSYTMEMDNYDYDPATETITVNVCAGAPVTFTWNRNEDTPSYDDDISFTILKANGDTIYNCADASGLVDGFTYTENTPCGASEPEDSVSYAMVYVISPDETMGTVTVTPEADSVFSDFGMTFLYYEAGTSVTVTATPATGYVFSGWSTYLDELDTIIAANPYTFVAEADGQYVFAALFASESAQQSDEDSLTVILAVNDPLGGSITPNGTVRFALGDTAAYSVIVNAGYQIDSVTMDATVMYQGMPYTFHEVMSAAEFPLTDTIVVDSSLLGSVISYTVYFGEASEETVTVSVRNPYGQYIPEFVVTPMGDSTVTVGSQFTVTANSSNWMYELDYWSNQYGDTLSTENPYTFTATEDVLIRAIPRTTPFSVVMAMSSDPNGGSVSISPAPDTVLNEYGSSYDIYRPGRTVTLTATPANGYVFSGWMSLMDEDADIITSNPLTIITPDTNATFYYAALFASESSELSDPDSLTIVTSVNNPQGGSITPSGTTRLGLGESFIYSVTVNEGYHLAGVVEEWTYTFNGAPVTVGDTLSASEFALSDTLTVSDSALLGAVMNLTVLFEQGSAPVEYTVTVSSNDVEMGMVYPAGTHTVAANTQFTAQARAFDGYHFVRWSTNDTTQTLTITVTGDIDLIAYFAPDGEPDPNFYTVTVVWDHTRGNVTKTPEAERYIEGSDIGLTANAYENYVFVAWLGENGDTLSTNTAYAITDIQSNRTLTAVFERATGIDEVDMSQVKIYSTESVIYVNGAEGQQVYLFDINGRVMNHTAKASESVAFRVTNTGVYLVKVGNAAAKRVVVMR